MVRNALLPVLPVLVERVLSSSEQYDLLQQSAIHVTVRMLNRTPL